MPNTPGERVFIYRDQQQLKCLAALLAEHLLEVGMGLKAVVPERFDRLHHRVFWYSNTSREAYAECRPHVEELLTLANEAKVLPFTTLEYDFYLGSRPRLQHHMHYGWGDLGLARGAHPAHFMEGWRPYSIMFSNAREPEDIRMVKEAALAAQEDRYKIIRVSAGLNPRDWDRGCSYSSGTDYDGHLLAEDGKVTIKGMREEGLAKMAERFRQAGIDPMPPALPRGNNG